MQQQKREMEEMVSNMTKRISQMESFQSDLAISFEKLSSAYRATYLDMEKEFDDLLTSLENKKHSFLQQVVDEETKKKQQMEEQLGCVNDTVVDAMKITADAEKALQLQDKSRFEEEMLNIKERITMSPCFRLSLTPEISDFSCWLAVDFSKQRKLIDKLDFLTAPAKPEFCEDLCQVYDNKFYCEWKLPLDEDEEECGGSQLYNLQFRQVDTDKTNQSIPWKTVSSLTDSHCLIEDLLFHTTYLQVRCQARNKFIPGEYSNIMSVITSAYSFQLDSQASHGNIKLLSPHTVEWDAPAIKAPEPRSRPTSAADNRSSPKRNIKPKDRFIGESYTILGDTPLPCDENSYFEVVAQTDSKTYGIGITHNSLSRYEQLGRTSNSWAIFVNKWIQNSIVAKHNNKMKTLNRPQFSDKIAVFYNPKEHYLSFYDAQTRDLLHSFKQVKRGSSAPLVVGLSVWKGGLQVYTGLQVPSWVEKDFAKNFSPAPSVRTTSLKLTDNEDEDTANI